MHGSARALLEKATHPAHPLGRRPTHILPVVVQGADFPVNPVTTTYAHQKAAAAGWLTQPECDPLLIVTLNELEMVEALVQAHDAAGEVIRGYAASGARGSLRYYIVDSHGGSTCGAPCRCRKR